VIFFGLMNFYADEPTELHIERFEHLDPRRQYAHLAAENPDESARRAEIAVRSARAGRDIDRASYLHDVEIDGKFADILARTGVLTVPNEPAGEEAWQKYGDLFLQYRESGVGSELCELLRHGWYVENAMIGFGRSIMVMFRVPGQPRHHLYIKNFNFGNGDLIGAPLGKPTNASDDVSFTPPFVPSEIFPETFPLEMSSLDREIAQRKQLIDDFHGRVEEVLFQCVPNEVSRALAEFRDIDTDYEKLRIAMENYGSKLKRSVDEYARMELLGHEKEIFGEDVFGLDVVGSDTR